MNDECDRVTRLLGPLFDGRLQGPVRGALLQHLRECLSCLDAARAIKRLALAASRSPRPAVDVDFAARVRRAIEARAPKAFSASRPLVLWRRIPRGVRIGALGFAASLVLAAVFAAGYARGRSHAYDSLNGPAGVRPYLAGDPREPTPGVEPASYRRRDD